jgi:hypothetical protein
VQYVVLKKASSFFGGHFCGVNKVNVMNRLISSRLVMVLGLLITSMSIVTELANAQTSPPNSNKQIWSCSATSGSHTYIVDQLILDDETFDMAIYQGSTKNASGYTGTVTINSTFKNRELVGSGKTYDSTIEVQAFGRTPAFSLRDNMYGEASGTCYVRWDMADSATRKLVRQCLAFAERKYGGIAAVTERGCSNNPRAMIQDMRNEN